MNGRSMTKVVGSGLLIGALMLGSTAQAQLGGQRTGDPRISQVLDAIGWKYQVDQDGDYVLCFGFEGHEQGQTVYVGSATSTLGTLEIREIFAPGIISESPLDAAVLDELLVENCRFKVGAWRLVKNSRQHVALFAAQLAADADPRSLATIVQVVALTAQAKRDSQAARVHGETQAPAGRSDDTAPTRPTYVARNR